MVPRSSPENLSPPRSSTSTVRSLSTPRPRSWPGLQTRPRPRATCSIGLMPPISGSRQAGVPCDSRTLPGGLARRPSPIVSTRSSTGWTARWRTSSSTNSRTPRPCSGECCGHSPSVIRGGEGRSFFCVGDVKQAIYGWRGGVAEIFDALDDEFGGLPSTALNESFRSSPVVIDCVNKVFSGIAGNPVLQNARPRPRSGRSGSLPTPRPASICPVTAAWSPPRWPRTARTKSGHAPARGRRNCPAPPSRRRAGASACSSAATRPWPGSSSSCDSAVSTPAKKGGNPLTDSPAVQLILSLLDPRRPPRRHDRAVSHRHLAAGPTLGLTDHADSPAAWRLAEQIRRRLMVDGYGPELDRWAKELAAVCDRRDVSRLEQLVEIGLWL